MQNTEIYFEGSTDDTYETQLTVTDPTADRTITLPDATGTVLINSGNQTLTGDLKFPDNEKAIFGTGNDLQIYHETTYNNSVIQESGSGNLLIGGNQINFREATLNTTLANFSTAVDLYYNGSKVFETTASGATVTGTLTTTSGITFSDGTTQTSAGASTGFSIAMATALG